MLIDKFFYFDINEKLWINALKAEEKDDIYTLHTSKVSTCSPTSPDWTISFNKGTFDKKDEWVNLYHPVLYAGKVPVFYLPYIGFPTSKKRRSGLLRAKFGISNKEGYLIKQPIYLSPDRWWDLTFTPEIRSKRGRGYEVEFRFADSINSHGKITIGEFIDYPSFREAEDLQNSSHRGYRIDYEKNRIFSDNNKSHDGLYLNFNSVNDIDYLSLNGLEPTKIITSKLNYIYYTSDDYLGFTSKYIEIYRKETI